MVQRNKLCFRVSPTSTRAQSLKTDMRLFNADCIGPQRHAGFTPSTSRRREVDQSASHPVRSGMDDLLDPIRLSNTASRSRELGTSSALSYGKKIDQLPTARELSYIRDPRNPRIRDLPSIFSARAVRQIPLSLGIADMTKPVHRDSAVLRHQATPSSSELRQRVIRSPRLSPA